MTYVWYSGQEITPLQVIFFVAELLVNTLSLAAAFLFFRVLRRTQTIHRNLKASFYNLVPMSLIISLCRYVIIPNVIPHLHFIDPNRFGYQLFASVHDVALYMAATNEWSVAAERLLSTFSAKSYERNRCPLVTIAIFVLPWCMATLITVLLYFEHLTLLRSNYVITGMCLVSWIVYAVIGVVNRHHFRMRIFVGLSQRYQMAENIHIQASINAYIMTTILRNTMTSSITYYSAYRGFLSQVNTNNTYNIRSNIYDFIVSVYQMVTPLLIMYHHGEMRRHMAHLLRVRHYVAADVIGHAASTTADTKDQLRGVCGNRLIMDAQQIDYFRALQKCWDRSAGETRRVALSQCPRFECAQQRRPEDV